MLHAASMLTGLWIIWLLAFGWRTPLDASIAAIAAAACIGVFLRPGGPSAAITRLPLMLLLSFKRIGAIVLGALATLRSAVAADVTLKPALVRVKSRAVSEAQRADFGAMVSATSGMVVVDVDQDGMLVHVIDEEGVDAVDLGRLEAQIVKSGDFA